MTSKLSIKDAAVKYRYLLFLMASAITLLFMSRCSFLYPMSDTADANCFLNSAKYMMSGKVLYNDFFEQKGPVIYFLHILALRMIPNSFHGVYIIETASAFFYCFLYIRQ